MKNNIESNLFEKNIEFRYSSDKNELVRTVLVNGHVVSESKVEIAESLTACNADDYDKAWLMSKKRPISTGKNGTIKVIDLFSGCGGLSLGISEACRALEYEFLPVLAADLNMDALKLYVKNFHPTYTISEPIEKIIDGELGDSLSESELSFKDQVGEIDILIGGPPCQGNSDLNNHTRRDDPRNLLYLRMIRCAEILQPKSIIIENVPGVKHDTHGVVYEAKKRLEQLGYLVDCGTIDMSTIGVAQKRKRFFMVATKDRIVSISRCLNIFSNPVRPLEWAIEDLVNIKNDTIFDTSPIPNDVNKNRIAYLFDHDIYELPNSERPDCHRLKKHSYNSVYGRMYWDRPAPTITGGFGSNGRGRFVHSKLPRTITPHEAARIQFFPDFFDFGINKRLALQQIIGNAVPSKASFILGLEILLY